MITSHRANISSASTEILHMEAEVPLPISKQPCHFSSFRARLILSPLRHSSWWFNLVSFSQPRLRLPSVLFHSRFPNKLCMHLSPPTYVQHAHAFYFSWSDHPNNIWLGVLIIKIFIMQPTPLSYYLFRLRPKYIPEYPILKRLQPLSLAIQNVDSMLKAVLYSVLCLKISELCTKFHSLKRNLEGERDIWFLWVSRGQMGVGCYWGNRKEMLLCNATFVYYVTREVREICFQQ
jgi:hypothetical protein